MVVGGALVSPATAAGPDETQVLKSTMAPRAGSAFPGVALTVFGQERRENGIREIRFGCSRGSVKLKSGRTLHVPVTVTSFRSDAEPGEAESVWTCTWFVPRGVRGRKLTATFTIRNINADGTDGLIGEPVAWTIH